jgi:hypothetical protein
MIIRQDESTPIGNYTHDNGIIKQFEKIAGIVDEFEVDTDELSNYCDSLIENLKGLKAYTKKVEVEWEKKLHRQKVKDETNAYN